MSNPCLSCGACCAYFRVSFYWAESEPFLGGQVPGELTVPVNRHLVAMQGTASKPARCVALSGEVGCGVACTIYERRPSPCRELQPAWLDGEPSEKCDRARAAHGLPPLNPDDVIGPQDPGYSPVPVNG